MIPLKWVEIDRSQYPTAVPGGNRMPLERATILAMLDDDKLYFPSNAAEVGYLKGTPEYVRTRKAFAYFGAERGLTHEYDNLDKLSTEPGAWYGSSWKWALGSGIQRVADLMDELKRHMETKPASSFWLDGETIIEGPYPDRFFGFESPAKPTETPVDRAETRLPDAEVADPPADPESLPEEPFNMLAPPSHPQRRPAQRRTLILVAVLLALCGGCAIYYWNHTQQEQPPPPTTPLMFLNQEFLGPNQ